jgi:ABC-type bacteriocin/lantibiotic exporter with double-glycine peptidase domain
MLRSRLSRLGGSLYSLIMRETLVLQGATLAIGLALPALAVFPLFLQKRIIDEAIPAADLSMVAMLGLLYAGVTALRAVIKSIVAYLRGWMAEIVSRILRDTLIDAQRRRGTDHAHRALGPATSVLTAEVEPLGGFAAEAISTPVIAGTTLLAVIGFMLYAEMLLAAIGIAGLLAEAVVTPILQMHINRLTHRRITALRHAGGAMIRAAPPGQRSHVVAILHGVRTNYRLRMQMNLLKALLKAIRNIIERLADVLVLGVGAAMVIRGDATLGVVVAFLAALRELRGPWTELVDFYRRFSDAFIKHRLVVDAIGNRDGRMPSWGLAAGPEGPTLPLIGP